jgi:16S rRNA (guanine(966)-N(2))-methyltransferase RsmD
VRLIGGRWKRSKLPVLRHAGLRPTPDRVRETLFNWLGQDLSGWRCLDAFAGSGALGFEAASRGAAQVLMLERDAKLVASLRAVQQRLGAEQVRVEAADALAWMARHGGAPFDLVLIDPPFDAALWDAALAAGRRVLAPDGWLYLEADRAFDAHAMAPQNLLLHRHARAGRVHAHLLRPAGAPDSEA